MTLQDRVYEVYGDYLQRIYDSRGIYILNKTYFYVIGRELMHEVQTDGLRSALDIDKVITRLFNQNHHMYIYDVESLLSRVSVKKIQGKIVDEYNHIVSDTQVLDLVEELMIQPEKLDDYIYNTINSRELDLVDLQRYGLKAVDVDKYALEYIITKKGVKENGNITWVGSSYLDSTREYIIDTYMNYLDDNEIVYDPEVLPAIYHETREVILGLNAIIEREGESYVDEGIEFLNEYSASVKAYVSGDYTASDLDYIKKLFTDYVKSTEPNTQLHRIKVDNYVSTFTSTYPLKDIYLGKKNLAKRNETILADINNYMARIYTSKKEVDLPSSGEEGDLKDYIYAVSQEKGVYVDIEKVITDLKVKDIYVKYSSTTLLERADRIQFITELYELMNDYVITYDNLFPKGYIEDIYDSRFNGKEYRFTHIEVGNAIEASLSEILKAQQERNRYAINRKEIVNSMIDIIDEQLSTENYFGMEDFSKVYGEFESWSKMVGITYSDSLEDSILRDVAVKRRIRDVYSEYYKGEDTNQVELHQYLLNELYDIANEHYDTSNFSVTRYDKDIFVLALNTLSNKDNYDRLDLMKLVLSSGVVTTKRVKLYEHYYIESMVTAIKDVMLGIDSDDKEIIEEQVSKVSNEVMDAIRTEMLNNVEELEKLYDSPNKRIAYHLNNLYAHLEKEGIEISKRPYEDSLDIGEIDAKLDSYLDDTYTKEDEIEGMLEYLKGHIEPYIKPLRLNEYDRQVYEMILRNKILGEPSMQTMYAEEGYMLSIDVLTNEQLLELKSTSDTKEEFESKINQIVQEKVPPLVNTKQYKEKTRHFNPHNVEFTFEDKLYQLNNEVVKIEHIDGSTVTTKFITRNKKLMELYMSKDSDYIKQGYDGIESYVKDKYGIDRTGVTEESKEGYEDTESDERKALIAKYEKEVKELNIRKVKGVRTLVSSRDNALTKARTTGARRGRGRGRTGMGGYGGYGGYGRGYGRRGGYGSRGMGRRPRGYGRTRGRGMFQGIPGLGRVFNGTASVLGVTSMLGNGMGNYADTVYNNKKKIADIKKEYVGRYNTYIKEWNIALDDLYVKYGDEMKEIGYNMNYGDKYVINHNKAVNQFRYITLRNLGMYMLDNTSDKIKTENEIARDNVTKGGYNVRVSTEDIYVMELRGGSTNLGEGQIIALNIGNIAEYNVDKKVSGWTTFHKDKDAWFKLLYGKGSFINYYEVGKELANDLTVEGDKARELYEYNRQNAVDEPKEEEQEEVLVGDYKLLLNQLQRDVLPHITLSMHDVLIYKELYSLLSKAKVMYRGGSYAINGVISNDKLHVIVYSQGEITYLLHPRIYIDVTHNKVLVDRTGIVRIGRPYVKDIPYSQEELHLINTLAEEVKQPRKKVGLDYVRYTEQDSQRIKRLAKILPKYKALFGSVGVHVEFDIQNTNMPKFSIKVKGKEGVKEYVYIPSVLTTTELTTVYYAREHGVGSDIEELGQGVKKIVNNKHQYTALMEWLKHIDLRKRIN